MPVMTTLLLAANLSLAPTVEAGIAKQIEVDCESPGELARTLARAKKLGQPVDIYLHGVCRGHFVIDFDGVTLRAGTPGSGIAAPEGDPGEVPLIEILEAEANLRGLSVQGGVVGVFVEGWHAEVLLYDLDVHESEVGVYATRGAHVRVLESAIHDGNIGIVAQSDSSINLQHVAVSNQVAGVIVSEESFAALSNTTIEDCTDAGLHVDNRSDANVIDCTFHENGQVHVSAADWSHIALLSVVTVGSETDPTTYALSAGRGASIASYSSPALYGHAAVLDRGSIQVGNTVLHGDLVLFQFANAHVRNSEITGSVYCTDGSDAICNQTTTGGASGCPSPTCGSVTAETAGQASAVHELPQIEVPRLEPLTRSRPRR